MVLLVQRSGRVLSFLCEISKRYTYRPEKQKKTNQTVYNFSPDTDDESQEEMRPLFCL